MSKFTYSASFAKLETSKSSRLRRAEAALRGLGVPREIPIDGLRATNQASASVCKVGCVDVLISYATVVAARLPDGTSLSTPRNYYSRTTDRGIASFLRGETRYVSPELFAELLLSHLGVSAS